VWAVLTIDAILCPLQAFDESLEGSQDAFKAF
jgi:hypothetical protein